MCSRAAVPKGHDQKCRRSRDPGLAKAKTKTSNRNRLQNSDHTLCVICCYLIELKCIIISVSCGLSVTSLFCIFAFLPFGFHLSHRFVIQWSALENAPAIAIAARQGKLDDNLQLVGAIKISLFSLRLPDSPFLQQFLREKRHALAIKRVHLPCNSRSHRRVVHKSIL